MVRKATAAFFDLWKQDGANVDAFFRLLEGTESKDALRFRDACFELKVPYTLMYSFVHGDPALRGRYEAVLAAKADALAHEALDDVAKATDRHTAAVAKVQADTKLRIASKWDAERYGDRLQVDKNVSVTVDAGLLGTAAELLRVAETRERLVEGETLTLPAPDEVKR